MAELDNIANEILKMTLSFYSNFSIPRKEVQITVDSIAHFISNTYIPSIEYDIKLLLHDKCDKRIINDIECILKSYKNPFSFVDTEHKRFELYKKKFGFTPPEEIIIGHTTCEEDSIKESQIEPVYAVHISLKNSLKIFLESSDTFSQLMSHMSDLNEENDILSNYLQSESWKRRINSKDKIIVPLNVFGDDLETGNALGSHAGRNKLGAVYVSIPCLPPHLVSQLNSILLATLYYSNDRKIFGNKVIFRELIKDLNDLKENGLLIDTNNIIKIVYFESGLILGDNLGLNGILGFVECFNANHPCRICLMDISEIKKSVAEDKNLIRSRDNYDKDVAMKNVSLTGIKEECVFHQIKNYHITENQTVDIMHDVHEGSGNYAMSAIIHHLIFVDKLFHYDELIRRLETFPYGSLESSNKPPPMSLEIIKKKQILKMSASEMGCFIRYFGLMVGDLVPPENEVWKFYKTLRQIFDIIMAPKILRSDSEVLNDLVIEYNKMYIIFVGNLTIKSHNMIHYPRLMIENGPLVHLWCMRYESKNKHLKSVATSTFCTKNLLKTIAIRNQLQLITENSNLNDHNHPVTSLENDDEKKKYFPNIPEKDIELFDRIVIHGQTYKKNTIVITDVDGDNGPQFGKIYKICQIHNEVFFIMNEMPSIAFDDHYHAWIIDNNRNTNCVKNQKSLPVVVPCFFIEKKNVFYVAIRHGI